MDFPYARAGCAVGYVSGSTEGGVGLTLHDPRDHERVWNSSHYLGFLGDLGRRRDWWKLVIGDSVPRRLRSRALIPLADSDVNCGRLAHGLVSTATSPGTEGTEG